MTKLLTRKDLAARLGVSYNTAGVLMKRMPVVQIGGRTRITEEALEAWIEGRTVQPIRLAEEENKACSRQGLVNGRIPTRKRAAAG